MKKRLMLLPAALLVFGMLGTSSVAAAPTSSEQGSGNPACSGTKIEPVADGVYAIPGGTIEINVYSTAKGNVFDWNTSSGVVVNSITVKGGTGFITYFYAGGAQADNSGLHAPLNLNNKNNQWYGLSHLCISSGKKTHTK